MQQLSRNCFISPTTAGIMDSAKLGILITILFLPTASYANKNYSCRNSIVCRYTGFYSNLISLKV